MVDGKIKPPSTIIYTEKTLRWKDVRDLVFESIEYGVPSEFDSKKLAKVSFKLLAKKQEKSKLNLSFYSILYGALDNLTDDELRKLALHCISKCTDNEMNCQNIVPIANKVGVIHKRYFDYMYRGKPYNTYEKITKTEEDLAKAEMRLMEDSIDLSEHNYDDHETFDIGKALGYVPFQD